MIAVETFTKPSGTLSASCSIVPPGNTKSPVSSISVYGVIKPSSNAAVAVASLKVDPGGWKPCTAQLFSGYPSLFVSSA